MGPGLFILLAMMIAVGVGLLRVFLERRRLRERMRAVGEYAVRFGEFVDRQGYDDAEYLWLTQKAPRIQQELGPFGTIAYESPYLGTVEGHQPLSAMLPRVREAKRTGEPLPGRLDETAHTLRDALVRYTGVLEEEIEEKRREMQNPFSLLANGVSTVLLLPLYVLASVKLVGGALVERIEGSCLWRSITGLSVLFGLLSSIVTMIAGWDETVVALGQAWRWRQATTRPLFGL